MVLARLKALQSAVNKRVDPHAISAVSTRAREFLVAQGYLCGWKVVRVLPAPLARAIFTYAADIFSKGGTKPARLRRNLSIAEGVREPELANELARDAVRSYARYWMEAFRLPSMARSRSREQLITTIENSIEGSEHIADAHAKGKGVILVLPHSGNWDMAGLWLAGRYGTFATVAERLKPEVLYDAFVAYRESMGFTVFPLTGGKTKPMDELRSIVEQGGIVALLGERDLTHRGVSVSFFDRTASMPAGAAKLAQETGASLHAVHCWFTQKGTNPLTCQQGWGFSVSPPVNIDRDVTEIVQDIADHFEANIARHPADWHMFQRVWIDEK